MKPTYRDTDKRWMVFIPSKLSGNGKRVAKYFPSKTQAEKFIQEFKAEHREHGRSGVKSEEREWISFSKNELGNLSILPEVIRHWKRTGEVLSRIAIDDAVREFLSIAEKDFPNRRTFNDIRGRIIKFRAAFSGRQVHEISATDIEHFLERSSAGWDRWSVHKRLGPFWKFALRRKWTAVNPLAEIPTPKTPTPERLIYTPEQFQSMLWLAETDYPSLLPFVTLAGFAFLRTAELVGMYAHEQILRWSDVHWDAGLIHVRPGVAKGTRRGSGDERYTPLTDAARSWLEPIKKESGPCVAMGAKKFGELWREMTDVAKVPRIDNGLRHSAISYSLAANPEHGVALTSQWAGNSEKTIRKHYRRLIAPSLGKAWFSVRHHADVTVTYHQPGEETPF